ncbi:MAG: NAD(P)H dehydrogenase (quinone) [Planctomycetota bacterium]|jgi:NAD(P)H dehydrogenase (quinone)
MNILVIYTHPRADSLNHSLLEATIRGLEQAGHQIKVADLYAENFQPAMTVDDFSQFELKPMPADVLAEQARIEWSDALVFIFPLWWWSVPGMLKGWIDRVMSYSWAWFDPMDPTSGSLGERKILVMVTAGASQKQLAKRKYDESFHTQLNIGTWDYCGFRDVTTRVFYRVNSDSPRSLFTGYLAEAEQLAATTFTDN